MSRPTPNHQVHQYEQSKYHWCVQGTKIIEVEHIDSKTGEKLKTKEPITTCLDITPIPKRYFCEYDKTGKINSFHHITFSYSLECEDNKIPVEPQKDCECCEIFDIPEYKDLTEIVDNYKIVDKKLVKK